MERLERVQNLTSETDQLVPGTAAVRLAVVDSDSGFVRVLCNRVGAVGWRAEVLTSPPPVEELHGMRQHAIVIDPAVLGSEAWPYLGQLCSGSSAQAVVVCTGPTSVAQRVRGCALRWTGTGGG